MNLVYLFNNIIDIGRQSFGGKPVLEGIVVGCFNGKYYILTQQCCESIGSSITLKETTMTFIPLVALPVKELVSELLIFIYSFAHYLGSLVIYVFGLVVPQYNFHKDLADPLGFLAVITGFLILYKFTQKVAWGILLVGWLFVAIRVLIVLFE